MDYKKIQKKLAPLLNPVASAYAAVMRLRAAVMRLRAAVYAHGLKNAQTPRAFCVSVGNIAWGGSGKTPLAGWLLDWGKKNGLVTALLTRGYGGKSEERPLLVKPRTNPDQSGDEALMLARSHPDSYILADPRRRRALDWLEANSTTDFIVLDDGMQHLAVRRHLDLVLLRAKDLSDEIWGRVIPAGEWREPATALNRASAFLLRMSPAAFLAADTLIKKRLGAHKKPIFSFDLEPNGLIPLHNHAAPLKNLDGRPYALCTGVGSPEQVQASAEALLRARPAKSFIYPDHHKFSAADLKLMSRAGLPVIMTAKDAVKIFQPELIATDLECYVLESQVTLGPHLFCELDFPAWLDARWREQA